MKAVMYHYVRNGSADYPYFRYLAFDDFCRQLDYFAAHGGIVPRERFVESLATGRPESGYVLTFDDGLSDHANFVIPELLRRRLWGIFYIPTGPYVTAELLDVHKIHLLLGRCGGSAVLTALEHVVSEDMLTDKEVPEFRELTYVRQDNDADTNTVKRILNYFISYEFRPRVIAQLVDRLGMGDSGRAGAFYMAPDQIAAGREQGMIMGSHSVTHRLFSKLPEGEQRREIKESFAWLEQVSGRGDVKTFCYPYGGFHSFTPQTEALLDEAGVTFSFNVEMRDITETDLHQRRQALPRFDCNKFPFGKAAIGLQGSAT